MTLEAGIGGCRFQRFYKFTGVWTLWVGWAGLNTICKCADGNNMTLDTGIIMGGGEDPTSVISCHGNICPETLSGLKQR